MQANNNLELEIQIFYKVRKYRGGVDAKCPCV